jgi:hypothetical protein
MKVPEELLKKWQDLRSFGDGRKIVDQNEGINEMDISRAFFKCRMSRRCVPCYRKILQGKRGFGKALYGLVLVGNDRALK